jgi:hypothetical protein
MNELRKSGIDRSGLPKTFLVDERRKSILILEANLLRTQEQYEAAAVKFAAAAEIEERLAAQLATLDRRDKAFVHQFSAISCWVQAGNLYRALRLGETLLQAENLPEPQRQRVKEYLDVLHSRFVQWMSQWAPDSVTATD